MVFHRAAHRFSKPDGQPTYANNAPTVRNIAIEGFAAKIFFQLLVVGSKIDYVFTLVRFYTPRKRMGRLKPTVFHLTKPHAHAQNLQTLPIEYVFGELVQNPVDFVQTKSKFFFEKCLFKIPIRLFTAVGDAAFVLF